MPIEALLSDKLGTSFLTYIKCSYFAWTNLISKAAENVNFPGSLTKSPVGPKLKTIASLRCLIRNVFLENVALKSNYHCVHMNQLGSIQPISIDSHSTLRVYVTSPQCTAWYAKAVEAANLTREVGNFAPNPCFTRFWKLLNLALPASKICALWALFNLKGIFLLHYVF